MKKHASFSLIELLVVVLVIAILVALLLPSLMKAKRGALSTLCQSNLNQQHIAHMEYTNDNAGFYLSNYDSTQAQAFMAYAGNDFPWKDGMPLNGRSDLLGVWMLAQNRSGGGYEFRDEKLGKHGSDIYHIPFYADYMGESDWLRVMTCPLSHDDWHTWKLDDDDYKALPSITRQFFSMSKFLSHGDVLVSYSNFAGDPFLGKRAKEKDGVWSVHNFIQFDVQYMARVGDSLISSNGTGASEEVSYFLGDGTYYCDSYSSDSIMTRHRPYNGAEGEWASAGFRHWYKYGMWRGENLTENSMTDANFVSDGGAIKQCRSLTPYSPNNTSAETFTVGQRRKFIMPMEN